MALNFASTGYGFEPHRLDAFIEAPSLPAVQCKPGLRRSKALVAAIDNE